MKSLKNSLFRAVTGLNWTRIAEWRAAVASEAKTLGWWAVAASLMVGALGLGGVTRARWRRRMRACRRCPVYDRKARKCRVPGRQLGCGCWMPAKALVGDRQRACWRISVGDDVPAFV